MHMNRVAQFLHRIQKLFERLNQKMLILEFGNRKLFIFGVQDVVRRAD